MLATGQLLEAANVLTGDRNAPRRDLVQHSDMAYKAHLINRADLIEHHLACSKGSDARYDAAGFVRGEMVWSSGMAQSS